jgi:hypothetical protein
MILTIVGNATETNVVAVVAHDTRPNVAIHVGKCVDDDFDVDRFHVISVADSV